MDDNSKEKNGVSEPGEDTSEEYADGYDTEPETGGKMPSEDEWKGLRKYIAENYRPVIPEPAAFAVPAADECCAAVHAEEELCEEAQEAAEKPLPRASFKQIFGTEKAMRRKAGGLRNESAVFQSVSLDPSLGESFSSMLLRLTDEKGLTDPQVYKAANVSRAAFNSIKNGGTRNPSRQTVVGLAMALQLDWEQSKALMSAAGLAFSDNNLFDVIAAYCIKNRIYDVYEANCLMVEYDQPLIGRK